MPNPTPEIAAECRTLVEAGDRANAAKHLRLQTGWGLRACIDWIDYVFPHVPEPDLHDAKIARLRAALEYYADQFCEGFCKSGGGDFGPDVCSGCRARIALAWSVTP